MYVCVCVYTCKCRSSLEADDISGGRGGSASAGIASAGVASGMTPRTGLGHGGGAGSDLSGRTSAMPTKVGVLGRCSGAVMYC